MEALLLALVAGLGFLVAYHTYGRWLGRRIFALSAKAVCPSHRLCDNADYVPTKKAIVFGHHFTSIAGTGPIVGPAIAVMWGWLPALLWVLFGSIFIGAVHDLGSLAVSMRHNGQTIGDVAGRVLNHRVRILFLLILFMGLTIVLAIFGLVIATVFRQYPASIFPCTVQIPIAVAIGVWLHRRGASLLVPSIIALAIMYLTVVIGDENFSIDASTGWKPMLQPLLEPLMHSLHATNARMASWSNITWVMVLLLYSYVASVLPVWLLLQPRDYINSLQLLSAMGLIVLGLVAAAFIGGAPPVEGAERQPLEIVAPMWNPHPAGAPMIFPFLFITIACGAVSGFHCLVSSGTSSKQIDTEPDARFVGFGSMLTEGFLATLVIIACVAGLGLGVGVAPRSDGPNTYAQYWTSSGEYRDLWLSRGKDELGITRADHDGRNGEQGNVTAGYYPNDDLFVSNSMQPVIVGRASWNTRYQSWTSAGGLARTVGAFVDGSANLLRAIGVPLGVALALMGVLVASFAGTTLDTTCRLQRYVIQELAATFLPRRDESACPKCGHTLWQHETSPNSGSDATSAPKGRVNVATGGASREATIAILGDDAPRHSSPGGATETQHAPEERKTPSPLRGFNQSAPDAVDAHTSPSPLRGEDDSVHHSHGFHTAQSSGAPPVATFTRPSGAEEGESLAHTSDQHRETAGGDVRCPECGEIVTPEQIENAGKWMLPAAFNAINPIHWLTNKHGATVFAIAIAATLAALPLSDVVPGFWSTLFSSGVDEAWTWLTTNGGRGGVILWPLFGATNQLLAGLAFIVITFYLRRRGRMLWFLIAPMGFMLLMPMWAMSWQVFVGNADNPRWLMPAVGTTNWPLALIGIAAIAIEVWMIVEALLVWPRVRGVMESGATDVAVERARLGDAPHDSQSLLVGV